MVAFDLYKMFSLVWGEYILWHSIAYLIQRLLLFLIIFPGLIFFHSPHFICTRLLSTNKLIYSCSLDMLSL